MLRFIIIDDRLCKRELDTFLAANIKSVQVEISDNNFSEKTDPLVLNFEKKLRSKILVSTSDTLNVIDIQNIIRCESNRNYTRLYLEGDKTLLASKTLMDFEHMLKHHDFLRIHKSHLVNVNYIEKYIKTGGGHMLLKNGTQLPVAVRKKEYLFRELGRL